MPTMICSLRHKGIDKRGNASVEEEENGIQMGRERRTKRVYASEQKSDLDQGRICRAARVERAERIRSIRTTPVPRGQQKERAETTEQLQ